MEKLIITVAGVGAEVDKKMQPALPISAEEIGIDAARCQEAGASIYHLHVRLPDGTPTQDAEVYKAAMDEIRKRTDLIIMPSTGGGQGMSYDERLQPLELAPEMASLTPGSSNFGPGIFMNDEGAYTEFYRRMVEKGVRPEFEIFEAGQIANAMRLVKTVGPAGPLMHFDFVLGVPGSLTGDPHNLSYLVSMLPVASTWTCTGIGRSHVPVALGALALGGNVRLGLEDNIFYRRGVLAEGNAQLVSRVARMAAEADRECATPDEARRILKLAPYDS